MATDGHHAPPGQPRAHALSTGHPATARCISEVWRCVLENDNEAVISVATGRSLSASIAALSFLALAISTGSPAFASAIPRPQRDLLPSTAVAGIPAEGHRIRRRPLSPG